MTKATIDYSKSKIYRIESINEMNSEVYIGSTTKQYLSQRLSKHKANYRQWKKGAPHERHLTSYDIFEKYGVDNCQIVLIENYPCTTVEELRRREGYFIKHIKCVNKKVAGNTSQEVDRNKYIKYKERILEERKAYYLKNKDMIQQRDSKRINCECGSKHRHGDKAQHMRTKKHINYLETQKQAENVNIPDILVN